MSVNASSGRIQYVRKIADCAEKKEVNSRFGVGGTQHGELGKQTYDTLYVPGDCQVVSASLDGNGSPIILMTWVGSLELPDTASFRYYSLQGDFVGKGGLPWGHKLPPFEDEFLWNGTVGTILYSQLQQPQGEPWRGAGVTVEVAQSMGTAREQPKGSCTNPRNVITGEGWTAAAKDFCGWDWQDPLPTRIRARIGERSHEDVFSFSRKDTGVELEEEETGQTLLDKFGDTSGAWRGSLDSMKLFKTKTIGTNHYDSMGALAFTKHRIEEAEVALPDKIRPLLAEQGKLTLQLCNSSWFEDPRVFDVSQHSSGCMGVKLNPICLDSAYVQCPRTWICPRYCNQDYHCVTKFNAAEGESLLHQGSIACRGAHKGTHVLRGTCAARVSMCTNLTITTTPSILHSENQQCTASANPQPCKRDAIVMKFDRWGSFWWGLPVPEGHATTETSFWAGRAVEYLSANTEMADSQFANSSQLRV